MKIKNDFEKNVKITFDLKGKQSTGFFSNYFKSLTSIEYYLSQNYNPYIDMSLTFWNPTWDFKKKVSKDASINPWDYWFEQSLIKNMKTDQVSLGKNGIRHHQGTFNDNGKLNHLREVSNEYMKPKKYILDGIDKFSKEYKLGQWAEKDKKTLAIWARATEMVHFHKSQNGKCTNNPKEWVTIIGDYMKSHSDVKRIFIGADDIDTIDIIEHHFGEKYECFYLPNLFRKTIQTKEDIDRNPANHPWWLVPITECEQSTHIKRLGEEALLQTMLSAKCDYFIGNHSGFSNAILYFNNNKFIDPNWGHDAK